MPGGLRKEGLRIAVLAVVAVALITGCATQIQDSEAVAPDVASGKVLTFQRKSLTPIDGGRLVRPEELLAGDILLSADPGLASAGIRLLTTSPVSHAAIYVGNGEVAEALRGGVRLRSIDRVLKEETVVAAFRHPLLDETHAQRMSEFAREQVGKPYDFVGVVMHAPFALQRRVCELPGVPTLLREACWSRIAWWACRSRAPARIGFRPRTSCTCGRATSRRCRSISRCSTWDTSSSRTWNCRCRHSRSRCRCRSRLRARRARRGAETRRRGARR